jgi:hypothetical protein
VAAYAFAVVGNASGAANNLISQVGATELRCKRRSCYRVSKVPAKAVLTVFAATATKTCLDAALSMKRMHRIELLAEAAPRYGHLDNVRKFPLKDIGASATFVASHKLTGSRSPGTQMQQ